MPDLKDKPAPPPPLLIRERRQSVAAGGAFWQERVRALAPGEPLPDGAQVVEGGEPSDWQTVPGT